MTIFYIWSIFYLQQTDIVETPIPEQFWYEMTSSFLAATLGTRLYILTVELYSS